ncbi:MAG: hypothetical protein LPD71_13385 [Shewanella sp.]|nr:hypothetical protein [Shewanella sp.]MCF1431956.1 hypothetical protein [Shewanella sp.]MCF1439689.1 hypothetical protein [Shewanella sp.]MCF1456351.1 hypothetical protein [Shewanella sp.]
MKQYLIIAAALIGILMGGSADSGNDGFKIPRRKAWRFESARSYHL